MLEGHTLERILPPIIDDLDKYQFAILGSSLRSLGVPVSLELTRKNRRSVGERKKNKKGVDASCNASYEHIFNCQNVT